MNITAENQPQQDEQELLFFRSLKSEMNLFPTRKIVRIVRAVLTNIIQNLPRKQASEIINKLPSTLQLIFVGCWKSNEPYKSVVHLDELVDNICNKEMDKEVLFTNEVDALKYVLIVIKNLKIIFDKVGTPVFPYPMISEYQQAVQEGAV